MTNKGELTEMKLSDELKAEFHNRKNLGYAREVDMTDIINEICVLERECDKYKAEAEELQAVRKCDLVLYENTMKERDTYKRALELACNSLELVGYLNPLIPEATQSNYWYEQAKMNKTSGNKT